MNPTKNKFVVFLFQKLAFFLKRSDQFFFFGFHSLPARGWRSLKGTLHRKESHHIMWVISQNSVRHLKRCFSIYSLAWCTFTSNKCYKKYFQPIIMKTTEINKTKEFFTRLGFLLPLAFWSIFIVMMLLGMAAHSMGVFSGIVCDVYCKGTVALFTIVFLSIVYCQAKSCWK